MFSWYCFQSIIIIIIIIAITIIFIDFVVVRDVATHMKWETELTFVVSECEENTGENAWT